MSAATPRPTRFTDTRTNTVVEAMRFTAEDGAAVWEWADSKPMVSRDAAGNLVTYALRVFGARRGVDERADFGDWVVRDNGVFRVVKAAVFERNFLPVVDYFAEVNQ